jgi:predicted alpha-1,2-mannosidase
MRYFLKLRYCLFILSFITKAQATTYTALVNPFIGTGGHGHTYPGPSMPFGMIQVGPDTRLEGWDGCSGYHYSDTVVYGFSHTHLSGTGIGDYCDVLFTPTINSFSFNKLNIASSFSKSKEQASIGYYSTYLNRYKTKVSLTSSTRSALHKYQFPTTENAYVHIDLTHRDPLLKCHLEWVDDHTIRGYRYSKGWAQQQRIYFYAVFDHAMEGYALKAGNDTSIHWHTAQQKITLQNVNQAILSFGKVGTLLVKVGISAVSMDGAKRNLQSEIPAFDFMRLVQQQINTWDSVLSKIEVTGGTHDEQVIFYTALYHSFLNPNTYQDVDGAYLGRDFKIHKSATPYFSVFSLWDTYRATHPLLALIDRKNTYAFVHTFLTQYQQGGLLPIWELAANETYCMIGNHSIPVIADALLKGIPMDTAQVLKAMIQAVNRKQFGIDLYAQQKGLFADQESESVSKTLEYAFDDACIARVAKAIGKDSIAHQYELRAQSWKNVFDGKFMRARSNGGWWTPFNPYEVNNNYTEANAWQYRFYVPQDMKSLKKYLGGANALEQALDELFTASTDLKGRGQADITGLIGQYAHGNEPSHHMAFLYHYTHHPLKSSYYTQRIMKALYHNAPDGLSGNEDCGQMSSWYVMSAMGLYDIAPGVDNQYLLTQPLFDKITIHLENNKELIIAKEDQDRITFNGKENTSASIAFDAIKNGGLLIHPLEMDTTMDYPAYPHSMTYQASLIAMPSIQCKNPFKDSSLVTITHIDTAATLYYCIKTAAAKKVFIKYEKPFYINTTSTIEAYAIVGNQHSDTCTSKAHKTVINYTVSYTHPYLNSYTGGGKEALVDGLFGAVDFRLNTAWQGFQDTDMECIIDLKQTKSIQSIGLNCLQDVRAWVFFSPEVSYYKSDDGVHWTALGSVKSKIANTPEAKAIQCYTLATKTNTHYIKIVAKNAGLLPSWHEGKENPSILFMDEVIIK